MTKSAKTKKPDLVKMAREAAADDNRIMGYNLQLQAYARFIRKIGAIPVLDSNMVNFLQALLDQLLKITEFETFREETERERDLHGRDVAFVLACAYCGKVAFPSGVQLLAHLFNDPHDQVRKKNRFKKLHGPMTQDLVAFLEREKHILTRHHFRETLLEPLVDFYFLTKSFLSQTSRYLEALEKQEQQPSISVGRSVDEILGYVVELIDRAHCIESVPHCSTVLFQYPTYGVAYTCNNIVFTDVNVVMEYLHKTPKQPPQIQGNIFSLPRPPPTSLPNQMFAGQNLPMANNRSPMPPRPFVGAPQQSPTMGRPITRATSEIPPFATCPPPRMIMFPQPMPFLMRTPSQQMPMNAFSTPQQGPHLRRMLFNPSTPPQTPQSPQSPMFQRGPPPGFLLQMPPSPGSPPVLGGNAHSSLPPLNEAGTADHPIFNDYLKRFLATPKLDDLIETGNALCHFTAASLIPSELIRALKRTIPEAHLTISCFGAKVSGVGYETDNVNLYVDDGTCPKTEPSIGVLFKALLDYFSAHSGDWVLQNSKICGLWTHLKVKNCSENVYCQISFDSEPYCANTRLIRYFTGQYPVCQKLCYFVQEFAKLAELNFERNVIVVLAIFYLQMQNALPTVRHLQTTLDETIAWSLNFSPLPPSDLKLKPLASQDIRQIGRSFFHFYGHKLTPLSEYVLCPYDGQIIGRSDFSPANEWRLPQPRYRAYLESAAGVQLERLDVGGPMCVQDLLVLKTNIAGKVSADDCKKFVRLCRMADEFYANNAL
ncbi:uncharacterized protein LOC120418917 [Culex pipiens pallens]|uniref:uncharacterized protein LOC120418917 n=1 Tax=Culex pipiens pallens TaxID=42434 RepID=UPI001953F035|nr:uncharacterized protein LOC120418917 [Culex pipiens pallens]